MVGDKFAFVKENVENKSYLCDVYKLDNLKNIFSKPAISKHFNIAYLDVSHVSCKRMVLESSSFERKMVCLPYKDGYALFPLLHEVERK